MVEMWFLENEPELFAANLGAAYIYHKLFVEGNRGHFDLLQRIINNTYELLERQ